MEMEKVEKKINEEEEKEMGKRKDQMKRGKGIKRKGKKQL